MALEEPVPQPFLILLAQPDLDAQSWWHGGIGSTRLSVLSLPGREGPRCRGIRQVDLPWPCRSWQIFHDEAAKERLSTSKLPRLRCRALLGRVARRAGLAKPSSPDGRRAMHRGSTALLPWVQWAGKRSWWPAKRASSVRGWLAATGFAEEGAGCRAGTGWWQCPHRFPGPAAWPVLHRWELMLVHSGCPTIHRRLRACDYLATTWEEVE